MRDVRYKRFVISEKEPVARLGKCPHAFLLNLV